jgi:heptosyltransferase I
MKILIVKLSAIGDVIHTLPALNAIRDHFPDGHITWLVEEAAAPILEGHEALDRVLISRRKRWIQGLRGPDRWKVLGEMGRFIRALRDTRYDMIFDFQQLLKSGVLVAFAKGNLKIGFDKGMQHMEKSYLFSNRRVPAVSMEHHALKRYLMLVEAAGIPVRSIAYHLPVTARDREAVSDLLEHRGGAIRGGALIAINPMAQWETKLWSNDRFAALADRLAEAHGFEVVFTGGPGDEPMVGDILSRMRTPAVDLAGRTSLKQLAALYERVRCVITTDTGPMHLAAAMGAPVLALFGPTAPWRTGPFGPGHRVISLGLGCSPCFKRRCRRQDRFCLMRVGVEDVLAGLRRLGIIGFSEGN